MGKINDLLNHIKDRFANPLIFSFICSWLVINWQIIIGLLWFNTSQEKFEGSSSIITFIEGKINPDNSLWFPLWFAIAYTIAAPIVKNLISAFYTWTSKWGGNWNLKMIKGGKISSEKYLKLREDYIKRSEILEKVITQESEHQSKYNTVNTELLEAKAEINKLQQEVAVGAAFNDKLYDVESLNGYWTNTYADKERGIKGNEDVYIQNGDYYIEKEFDERERVFNINDFYYDSRSKSVFFVKELVNQKETVVNGRLKYNINRLQFKRKDLLVGTENGTTIIEYKRKKP